MAFTNDLIDISEYPEEMTDLDMESPDIQKGSTVDREFGSYLSHTGKEDGWFSTTSPMIDKIDWVDSCFNTDQSATAKLVSSEEDLLLSPIDCNNHVPHQNGIKSAVTAQSDQLETAEFEELELISSDQYSHDRDTGNLESSLFASEPQDLDHDNLDGFASNDVITVGGVGVVLEEDEDGEDVSPDSRTRDSKSFADMWDHSAYNTVVRSSHPQSTQPELQSDSRQTNRPPAKRLPVEEKTDIGDDQLCESCQGRVYITERLTIDNSLYHKTCFKCSKCRRLLSINTFASSDKKLFCQTHFNEIFRQSGICDIVNKIKNGEPESSATGNSVGKEEDAEVSQPMQMLVQKFRQLEATSKDVALARPSSMVCAKRNFTQSPPSTNGDRDKNQSVPDSEEGLDEMPAPGFTRNLLSLWSSMTVSGSVTGLASSSRTHDSSRAGTPQRLVNRSVSQTLPLPRTLNNDVVKHDERLDDSFPAPQTAKMVAAKFREMERHTETTPRHTLSSGGARARPVSMLSTSKVAPSSNMGINRSATLSMSRAEDGAGSEMELQSHEMPESGTTRNLVGFFRAMEQGNASNAN